VRLARRQLLAGAAAVSAVGAAGCDPVLSFIARARGEGFGAGPLAETSADTIDPAFHLLSRAAYGAAPGDVERVRRMGAQAWLEEQLHPERIDDALCDLRARRFESLDTPAGELFEYKPELLRQELTRATVLRAIYSRRQLYEVMVGFWTDHLNIDMGKGDCAHLTTAYQREVIRRHALGRFRDLIGASALAPAMLVYLDGTENRRRSASEAPNENYARELLELHTLGVHGGYSQADVMEAARCLTGWQLRRGWGKGRVQFVPAAHDDGEKRVLGTTIAPGGGERDLERLLDLACSHSATARHVAAKLCRRFVAYDPPAELVSEVARVFRDSAGDIRATLRAVIDSDAFRASAGGRLKRPFRFLVSTLRSLAADTHARRPLLAYLERMGQAPFAHPTPDGYPDELAPWLGTLFWRWGLSTALADDAVQGVAIDHGAFARALDSASANPNPSRVFSYLVGRAVDQDEAATLAETAGQPRQTLALVLSSPAFQRC